MKDKNKLEAQIKIDGYSRIFEEELNGKKQSKDFLYDEFTIKVKLLLKAEDKSKVLENLKHIGLTKRISNNPAQLFSPPPLPFWEQKSICGDDT